MAGFLKVLLHNVLQGPSTDPYPLGPTFSPDAIRGKVTIDPEKCMGCGICDYTCVAGAIHIDRREDGHTITVYQNSCCLCANCRKYCPAEAIVITDDWHSAHTHEEQYEKIEQQTITKEACKNCGTLIRPIPLELAHKLYDGKTDIDPEHVRLLCPKCRQLEDAKRTYQSLPKAAAAK